MSIVVTTNSNGSYTITCGSDTVTVGGSSGAVTATPVTNLDDTGAVTACFAVPVSQSNIVDLPARDLASIKTAIQRHRRTIAGEASLLRIQWMGEDHVDMAQISEALRDREDPGFHVEVRFARRARE